jgi:hypothetical protein
MRLAVLTFMLASSTALADPPVVGSETIHVQGHIKVTMPKPHRDPTVLPPYNDAIILSDGWTRAWMLLDVSETGAVRRVKFLHHPGYGLDKIAVAEAFKQSFDPALDRDGNPAPALVVWPVEWPSHDWLIARTGVITRHITEVWALPGGLALPPCKGSGPLQLESVHPVYRDCTKPDLSHADASEPWLTRP